MTDDLLSRLTAVVDEAERKASNAARGPWRQQGQSVEQVSIYVIDPGHVDEPDAAHIAAWSPDAVLRHVEHARKVMARHVIAEIPGETLACSVCFAWSERGLPYAMEWPCADLLDLAAAWGVTP